MHVALRPRDDPGAAGTAAYLRILPPSTDHACLGGLLLVNAIAEPLELVRMRMRVPSSGLCGTRLTAAAAAAAIAPMLHHCRSRPDVLFFDGSEIDSVVFAERIALDVPIGVLSRSDEPSSLSWLTEPAVAVGSPGTEATGPTGAIAAAVAGRLAELGLIVEPWRRLGEVLRAPFPPAQERQ